MCILDAGAREETTGEYEGCVGSIDCGTCSQKQRGNHHHVQLFTAVKSAMVCVCFVKSATFFFQCANALTYQCWTVRRRHPHIGCGSSALSTNTSQWNELYKAPSTKCYKLMSLIYTFTHVWIHSGNTEQPKTMSVTFL